MAEDVHQQFARQQQLRRAIARDAGILKRRMEQAQADRARMASRLTAAEAALVTARANVDVALAGLQDFLGFWSTVRSVTVLAVTPRDDHSVTVRLRYVMNDGRVDTEDRWLSVVPADGRLRVYDSERIGPA